MGDAGKPSRVRAVADKIDRHPRSSVVIATVVAFMLGAASGGPSEPVTQASTIPVSGQAELQSLEQELASVTSELSSTDSELGALDQDNSQLTRQLRTSRREARSLRGKLTATKSALARARSTAQAATATSTSSATTTPKCDPNYTGACVPIVGYDLNCDDISGSVTVVGYDKHGFDGDGDGSGCE